MSDTAPAEPPRTAAPPAGLARLGRLARKELRETLRDRRTIVTLVLMPILVYPLLSVAFRQFLVTSFNPAAEVHLRIATNDEQEWLRFMRLLKRGDQLLREQDGASQAAPVGPGTSDSNAAAQTLDPAVSEIVQFSTPELEKVVRDQQVDLGVRLRPSRPADETGPAPLEFEILFRPNTPISRQAANYVERRLRAVNEDFVKTQLRELGGESTLPAAWTLEPMAVEEGGSVGLGSLVPLILILMTIAGAVYPSIDLTAGERERGTLEALMAAPVPRLSLLVAKYVAVVTVALLTAGINLAAMTITVASTGLAPVLFGERGLSVGAIAAVFALLVLFAAFFSAVLLSVTSFARSFKEAQAYLIPLTLVSLAPGFLSVMPGLELGPLLSVLPLANIVLLARDVLAGDASLIWGSVAVLTTALYGALALACAAKVFGSDAILYGSEGSWSDFFRQPDEPRKQATLAGALGSLAVVGPVFVVVSGILAQLHALAVESQLTAAAAMTVLVFLGLPLLVARGQGVAVREGFQLRPASPLALVGAVVLGATLWPLAYDLIILCQDLGIATLSAARLAEARPGLEALIDRFRELPLPVILLALAVAPAVCEEFFFRGYLLGALRGRLPAWAAIGLTGVIFGLFHASVGGIIAVERVLASTLLGLALGWVAWTTKSVLPGMVVHVLNNGLMLTLAWYAKELQARGWDLENERYLPPALVAATTIVACLGFAVVWWGRRDIAVRSIPSLPATN